MNHGKCGDPVVKVILDTDMGNDIDDALTLAMLHGMQSRGECELVGVSVCKDNVYAPKYVDAVNTFYGRSDVPIGMVKGGVTPNNRTFIKEICTAKDQGAARYPLTQSAYEDAVPMLRRTLVEAEDKNIVIVMIGFSTNMKQLFESVGDATSELDGRALFAKKVKKVYAMAGDFSASVQAKPTMGSREYNIHCDVEGAVAFFNRCPVPIDFSGYEIGSALCYPAASIEQDYRWVKHHPVAEAYCHYKPMPYDRPSWDQTTLMEAVRPGVYFDYSQAGRVEVTDEGYAIFHADVDGKHRYLKLRKDRMAAFTEDMVSLCSMENSQAVRAVTARS
ncbi:nucleoside hydrolase [Poriferisphaera sp. WC338]|uniref:nucleoside hydrolase n=1 Tax=Poriferisphaera sp. WC338 TaxID=3425129 RepID=UPI003D81AB4D